VTKNPTGQFWKKWNSGEYQPREGRIDRSSEPIRMGSKPNFKLEIFKPPFQNGLTNWEEEIIVCKERTWEME